MSSTSRPKTTSSSPPAEPAAVSSSVRDLTRSEDYLAAVLKTVIDAVITIDQYGIIVDANAATERIFGYRRDELMGQNIKMLMPSPYREQHDSYLARYMQTRDARVIGIGREVMARRKDGTTFPVDLAVSEIDHKHLFTGTIRDLSERKRLEREILAVAAEEQRRIGQDVHDGVGQELTGIGLFAQTLAETLQQEGSPSAELAVKIVASVERVQKQVRSISHGLVPVNIEAGGLNSALERLAESLTTSKRAVSTYTGAESLPTLSLLASNHLYRIAQEAVANAVRHGRAKHIDILLTRDPESLTLEIADDGVGMPTQRPDGTGVGMRSMSYRAHLIGGLLSVEPRPAGGTRIRCIVPEELVR